jgi:hypothetical protein
LKILNLTKDREKRKKNKEHKEQIETKCQEDSKMAARGRKQKVSLQQ